MNESINGGRALLNNRKNKTPIVFDILLLGFVLFFSGIVFFYYTLSFSPIKGNSMLNTIEWGQCVLLQRRFYTLERGDIVTLDIADEDEPHILIKRVVGLGGDKLLFVRDSGDMYVDMYICKAGSTKFTLMNEPYIMERMEWNSHPDSSLYETITVNKYIPHEKIADIDLSETYTDYDKTAIQAQLSQNCYTVPNGEIFFLGDNRNNSNDSRHYGSQPTGKIIGKVIKILEENSAAEKFFRFMFNNYEKA